MIPKFCTTPSFLRFAQKIHPSRGGEFSVARLFLFCYKAKEWDSPRHDRGLFAFGGAVSAKSVTVPGVKMTAPIKHQMGAPIYPLL